MKSALDILLVFSAGVIAALFFNGAVYALGEPRIIVVMALAAVALVITAAAAYALGHRHEKMSNLRAYNRGIRKGRQLGRAETQSEIQRFLED